MILACQCFTARMCLIEAPAPLKKGTIEFKPAKLGI